ncbi:MAG: ketopantoate reductase family protein [Bacteroidales bacterium]|nr:ketopantoate reductase family protein [Bacteroidales bacterium]MCF8389948.1 ketopantoate reductase family protein [Bacteroidales bacterium]
MNKKILIVGAGAVGGIISVILTKNGFAPDVIVKYPELKLKAKKHGLELKGFCGTIVQKVQALLPSDMLEEKYDIVFMAVKATDLVSATKSILQHLNEDSLVVSLQNGICEDELAAIVGKERTVGCVTGWGATMLEPGKYDMTSGGEFIIGNINDGDPDRLIPIKDMLSTILPCYISNNIYGELYSKLIINSCITTLGAVTGDPLGKMLSNPQIRIIFLKIISEAIDVSNAMGIKVEPYSGKLDFYKFLASQSYIGYLKRHFTLRFIGYKYRRLKSSSLQSLERGKPTEIDWFNGYIVSHAKKHKINVPINKALVEMIKEIEKGKRKIGMENFTGTFFS